MENNTNTQKIERATKTLPSGTCDSTLSLLSITGEGKRLGADALIVRWWLAFLDIELYDDGDGLS